MTATAPAELQPPFQQRSDDHLTPTATAFSSTITQRQIPTPAKPQDQSSQITPTRDSFTMPEKRSLPDDSGSPCTPKSADRTSGDMAPPSGTPKSMRREATEDHAMDIDPEGEAARQSDDESNADDASRPSKKKRAQKFYCTEYPPCNLSFTRSEHLARHIRKHTGERPFTCHCLRTFSRLDNLRQHAQTVHINEEIPNDSLAATGTRYQRQIRTDRVRPQGSRSRASTMGSGTHSRGHSRNISGSSIGSISDLGSPDETRRRPPPLAVAHAPQRPDLRLDTMSAGATSAEYFPGGFNYSPSSHTTPTSIFSPDASSPRVPSGLQSPINLSSRSIGWGGQNHSRRLSVPSSSIQQSPSPYYHHPASYMSPVTSSIGTTLPNSGGYPPHYGNVMASPPRPGTQDGGPAEAMSPSEVEWRRRTWHPGTRTSTELRPATSGLSFYQTPDDSHPVSASQPAAQQPPVRLPGIDSFDSAIVQLNAPPRVSASDMEVDETSQAGETDASSKRDSWNSMNQNLGQLEITQQTPPEMRHSAGSQTGNASRPVTAPHGGMLGGYRPAPPAPLTTAHAMEPPGLPAEQPVTPRKKKRQGFYFGPPNGSGEVQGAGATVVRTSPEGSSSSEGLHTPSTASVAEFHPAIVHSNGVIEPQASPEAMIEDSQKEQLAPRPRVQPFHQPPPVTQVTQNGANEPRRSDDTGRLDALVEAATREDPAKMQS